MSDNYIIKHSDGMWTSVGKGEPPADLLQSSAGSVALLFDEDGEIGEVRMWTGRSWKLLTGGDREWAIDWMKEG